MFRSKAREEPDRFAEAVDVDGFEAFDSLPPFPQRFKNKNAQVRVSE